MAHSSHLEPIALWIDHSPPGEVVHGCSPENSFFSTRVDRDVTADAGGICGGWIDRKDPAFFFSGFTDSPRHDASATENRRHRFRESGQRSLFNGTQVIEFFGIDDDRVGRQWTRASRVTRTAASGNYGEAQGNAGAH